jgi:hypothetical protein
MGLKILLWRSKEVTQQHTPSHLGEATRMPMREPMIHARVGCFLMQTLSATRTFVITRTFFFPRPKELNGSSTFLSKSLHPQILPCATLVSSFGGSELRYSRVQPLCITFLGSSRPEMCQSMLTFFLRYRDFALSPFTNWGTKLSEFKLPRSDVLRCRQLAISLPRNLATHAAK